MSTDTTTFTVRQVLPKATDDDIAPQSNTAVQANISNPRKKVKVYKSLRGD